eukprot:TRINITY_DN30_c0_g2_i1.p1 TRINITY_DN30_c0_g2~~TRINITY_DN30_c0_g2_i1.p1  ORF type:complete len:388 (-),score=92.35 TRINITY_DN30_c0_g2_i1:100-1164(-)
MGRQMSLFEGLKKCENPYCNRFAGKAAIGKYKVKESQVCSPACVRLLQISEFFDANKEALDKPKLMSELQKHFDSLSEELGFSVNVVPPEEKKGAEPIKEAKQEETKEKIAPSMELPEILLEPTAPQVFFKLDYIIPIEISSKAADAGMHDIQETLEFAAAIYSVKDNKSLMTFQKYIKPANTKLTAEELKTCGVTLEQVLQGKELAPTLEEFHMFLKNANILDKKYELLFVHHAPIEFRLLAEAEEKKITLADCFFHYVNLKKLIINLYYNHKGVLNTKIIENKCKGRPIENYIRHCEDMTGLLGIKHKERFLNNLDLVDNMVSILKKLGEKSVDYTTQYVTPAVSIKRISYK